MHKKQKALYEQLRRDKRVRIEAGVGTWPRFHRMRKLANRKEVTPRTARILEVIGQYIPEGANG